MSLINRLIREAKNSPAELTIKPSEVRKVALHLMGCTTKRLAVEQVEAWIRQGDVKLINVPIRVLGLTSFHLQEW